MLYFIYWLSLLVLQSTMNAVKWLPFEIKQSEAFTHIVSKRLLIPFFFFWFFKTHRTLNEHRWEVKPWVKQRRYTSVLLLTNV